MSRQSDAVDAEFARWLDETRAWGLLRLEWLYGNVDERDIERSFRAVLPLLLSLYATLGVWSMSAVDEYLWLKGALRGVSVRYDWLRGHRDAPTLLQSGQPFSPWMRRAPLGMKALISDGMKPSDAIEVSKARTGRAVGTVVHQNARSMLANRAITANASEVKWPSITSTDPVEVLRVGAVRNPALLPSMTDLDPVPPDVPTLREDRATARRVRRTKMRYRRVPQPGACAFCLTLASRGGVFESGAAALFVGGSSAPRKSSIQPNGGKFHDNCRCIATVDVEGMPDLILSDADAARLSERYKRGPRKGQLRTFGIGSYRYRLNDFTTQTYAGLEPPYPAWQAALSK